MKSYLDCYQPNHVIKIWDSMKKSSNNNNSHHFNIRRDMTSFSYILKALAKEKCNNGKINHIVVHLKHIRYGKICYQYHMH